ncbi:MAG: hypothetical protein WKF73_09455 [Nocardioidaceae bacterium]
MPAVDRRADTLAANLEEVADSSLYFGLTGMALTLQALGREDPARQALRLVRTRCSGGRWSQMFELFAGNAGIGLGALKVGDLDLAVDAVTPYLQAATRTTHGVNWSVPTHTPAITPHRSRNPRHRLRPGLSRPRSRPPRSHRAGARRCSRRRRSQ